MKKLSILKETNTTTDLKTTIMTDKKVHLDFFVSNNDKYLYGYNDIDSYLYKQYKIYENVKYPIINQILEKSKVAPEFEFYTMLMGLHVDYNIAEKVNKFDEIASNLFKLYNSELMKELFLMMGDLMFIVVHKEWALDFIRLKIYVTHIDFHVELIKDIQTGEPF